MIFSGGCVKIKGLVCLLDQKPRWPPNNIGFHQKLRDSEYF